jgi:hypothetical protein
MRGDISVNPLDPQCAKCFGPLNTDARHRFTLSAVWQGPWGVSVSGMFRYRSALPYTRLFSQDRDGDGTPELVDANGDGFALDLVGTEHVNGGRGDDFSQLDLRVAKEFRFASDAFGIELIAEMFNVFNEENPGVFNRFGQPNAFAGDPLQGEQQLVQLGARVRF